MNFKEFVTRKVPAALKKAVRGTWAYIKLARIELIILVAIFAVDLITKGIVQATIFEHQSVPVIPNFLQFTYTINTKAAFGSVFGLEEILSDAGIRIFLIAFTIPALAGFGYFMYRFRNERLLSRVVFAMIIAGTLGNFYDRLFITNGAGVHGVRDFIHFINLPLIGDFAIFNVADMSLVFGVILFAVYFIFMYKPPAPELIGPVYQPDFNKERESEEVPAPACEPADG